MISHPEIFSKTFQEELYHVPVKPIVALATAWQAICESEKILLEKILGLARISLNSVKVISTNKLDLLQWHEKPNHVIAFGIASPGLAQNEVIEIQSIKMIVTSSLSELETAEKEVKQKLSGALKQMFQP